jgi:AraC-like DNA-binding protein
VPQRSHRPRAPLVTCEWLLDQRSLAALGINLIMAIHEIPPSPDLATYVDRYWWSDESVFAAVRVLPDGCADIVVDQSGRAFAIGTMTRPLMVEGRESAGFFGIRFRPGRAAAMFRAPLALITDARVPLSDLTKGFPSLGERAQERIGRIEDVLRSLLANARPDARVDAAVEAIIRSGGRASMESIATAAGVSRQHLARSFAHHVGVSPKTFARIMRFRRALALARSGQESWADVALELGYFDQSHLIAEFREFAGETPVPFFLSSSK